MSEAATKYVDGWARQNAISKAHEENMQMDKAMIGQLNDLTIAIHRLAYVLEKTFEKEAKDVRKDL